ncbi:MAG: BamA/TamA family outer membrane protein [Paludibacteraceae bacterium]|nr:BamA/TamA family outer membrane protein [Paludibacteraceae bacterium]
MLKRRGIIGILFALLLLFCSCKVTKYVPDGQYLLDKVKVSTDNKALNDTDFTIYLRQRPNPKLFNFINFNLGLYSLSSPDTTLWINRFLQKIGDAPIIYDSIATQASAKELKKVMQNKGYTHATVETQTSFKKKKAQVSYHITCNAPYTINSFKYRIKDPEISQIVENDSANTLIKKGNLFDIDVLEQERQRVSKVLRNNGYIYFDKEYVGYTADTTAGNKSVDICMLVRPMRKIEGKKQIVTHKHEPYLINNVNYFVVEDAEQLNNDSVVQQLTMQEYKGMRIFSNNDFVRHSTLYNCTGMESGELYNDLDTEQSYARLSGLHIFKYLNVAYKDAADSIQVVPTYGVQDSLMFGVENNILNDTIRYKQVDCNIIVTPDKLQSFSFEIEGTNNEGDFGIAGKFGYTHNNIFKGAEKFKFQLRGANESLIGSRSIWDISTETGFQFPTFLFPFINKDFIWKNNPTTDVYVNFSYQIRREYGMPDVSVETGYSRIIAGAGIRYNWQSPKKINHTLTLLDFNYVYLPYISDAFKETIGNSLLKYSYEDHMIMSAGYGISYSGQDKYKNTYNVRGSAEIAGNLLYGICTAANAAKDANGSYVLGNIPFSQYVKFDGSFSYNQVVDEKNSIVYHAGFGIGVPYLNSNILPFEKRYYGGGANSVRGWSARSLGPGGYNAGTNIDYMKQSGDINLNLNVEYRTKLVWLLELAAFIDAGNIWTLADEGQEGGQFKWDQFYKQIALGYGIGLRLNFDFFVVRLDWGLKAFNPAAAPGEKWRFTPSWNILKDTALHFAVGYPF